jgi:hypothetical protein
MGQWLARYVRNGQLFTDYGAGIVVTSRQKPRLQRSLRYKLILLAG